MVGARRGWWWWWQHAVRGRRRRWLRELRLLLLLCTEPLLRRLWLRLRPKLLRLHLGGRLQQLLGWLAAKQVRHRQSSCQQQEG